ncbi:MAG: aldehyde dehydrogenase [Bacteroidia bacterium]|nr:aldehyde dehydrogenase [Bacteroidia bacterium]
MRLPERLDNFIGGRYVPPAAGLYLDTPEPATGARLAQVAASGPEDVDAAAAAALAAQQAWADLPVQERARVLSRIADGIEAEAETLAAWESADTGKPLSLAARMDIPRAVDNFRFFAQAITQFHGEAYDNGSAGFNYTLRRPSGPAGLISPWNLPLYLFTWKIAPALAAGCTAIAKPSELTPVTAWRLGAICDAAGLPPGVLNIVHGRGAQAGSAIVGHPAVGAISFTGSTATGRAIALQAAPFFKKLSLEMGGKNASIVFADADYEAALDGVLRAAFTNQGQICLCGSRILVENTIYERFTADLAARVQALKTGDPLDPDTRIGAIVSEAQWQKDRRYLDLAREEGGEVLCGGRVPPPVSERCRNGWFLEPALIAGLSPACQVNQEEIFGPVATVMPFRTEAEAIETANGTRYGLSATLWTTRLDRAHRVAAALEAGIVWVNSWLHRDLRTPFGGVKQSGLGREGGYEALRFFTEAKNIFIRL